MALYGRNTRPYVYFLALTIKVNVLSLHEIVCQNGIKSKQKNQHLLVYSLISSRYSLFFLINKSMASSHAEVIGVFSNFSIAMTLKSLNFFASILTLVLTFSLFMVSIFSEHSLKIFILFNQYTNIPKNINTMSSIGLCVVVR